MEEKIKMKYGEIDRQTDGHRERVIEADRQTNNRQTFIEETDRHTEKNR